MQNRIKIISNSELKIVAYYFMNENKEWVRVSNSSPLSRKYYVNTTIKERVSEILAIIDETYNVARRGVEITFEGTDEDYEFINNYILENYSESQISCVHNIKRIAVVGRCGTGKSTLISTIGAIQKENMQFQHNDDYDVYTDKKDNVTWYEVKGIDIGYENIENAVKTLEGLISNGLTDFIYCFSTTKIQDSEKKIICDIKTKYPALKVTIVLTQMIDNEEGEEFADKVEQMTGIKVISVLAKEYSVRGGKIPAYGMDQLIKYIYEEKVNG